MLRHYIHVHEEVQSRERTIVRGEVLMECLAEALEATHHFTDLEDSTPGLSVKPIQFDFLCMEAPSNVKVEPIVVQNNDYKYLWKVSFSPPLSKGQKVKYAFKMVRRNTRPWTYEEVCNRIAQGTYKYHEAICEASAWNIIYPTVEFCFTIDFPEEYEIADYRVDVRIGDANLNAEKETQRIREGGMFLAEKMFDKWSLSLKVLRPLQSHTYYIYYVPPRETPSSV